MCLGMRYLLSGIALLALMAFPGCRQGPGNSVRIGEAGIYIDRHEVTVEAFGRFVDQTGYQTTADSLGWAACFEPAQGWQAVPGANWQYPDGRHKADPHDPVTQVSYADAKAYCQWQGGRLPTAREWDLAAGENIQPGNIWQGPFPARDLGKDGYPAQVAPVGTFKPNDHGLYDMFGNVWEWTTTKATARKGRFYLKGRSEVTNAKRKGFIIKGGSYLCNKALCTGYNPADYQVTPPNSGLAHLGFRCVYEPR